MKAKELAYLLGLRPKPKSYGYEIRSFELGVYGHVEYAQWLHPRESQKTFSPATVDALRRFLSPGDVAIDIGAHSGDSALPMAVAVGGAGCVFALEPNPYIYPVLLKNAQLNSGKVRIIPLPFAATAEDSSLTFRYSDEGYCNGGEFTGISRWRHGHAFALRIEGKNLQTLLDRDHPQLLRKLRYIKIDTEGNDEMVVRSLAELISRYKPFLRIEVYGKLDRAQRRSLFGTVTAFGYTLRRIEGETNYWGEAVKESDMGRWRQFDVLCVPL